MSVHDLMAQAVPQSYTTLAVVRPGQVQGAGRNEVPQEMRHRKLETCPAIALYRIFE